MTDIQKQAIVEAQHTERPVLLVEVDDAQLAVATELGLDVEELQTIAVSAFQSSMRGKIQAAIDRAIKAKYIAEGKGKKALSEECEAEIQKGLKLKRAL